MVSEHIKSSVLVSTQMRPQGSDGPFYAPGRDITALVPELVLCALKEWEDCNNDYRKWADRKEFTDTHIGEVAEALASFLSEECVVDTKSVGEAIEKSGLNKLPPVARIVVFGMLGEQLVGAFWYAIRSATTSKDGEFVIRQYDAKSVAEEAHEFSRRMRMPPWKRRLQDVWHKISTRVGRMLNGSH